METTIDRYRSKILGTLGFLIQQYVDMFGGINLEHDWIAVTTLLYTWRNRDNKNWHTIIIGEGKITYYTEWYENTMIFDRGTLDNDKKIIAIIFSRIYPYMFQRLFTFTSKFDNPDADTLDADIISTIKGKYIDIL